MTGGERSPNTIEVGQQSVRSVTPRAEVPICNRCEELERLNAQLACENDQLLQKLKEQEEKESSLKRSLEENVDRLHLLEQNINNLSAPLIEKTSDDS